MSTCPRCHVALASDDYEGVAVETCARCHGQWLDADRLREALEAGDWEWKPEELEAMQRQRIRGVPADQARAQLPCPDCGRAMDAFNYGGDSGVILDKCTACGGIWLDGGELERARLVVAASDRQLDRDVRRFSGALHEHEVREDALEQRDTRNDPVLAALVNLLGDTD